MNKAPFIPQGVDQQGRYAPTISNKLAQGWPARRCSPEVQPHIVDRLRESYDREDQSDSADGVFWLYMAVIGAVIAAAIWAVWS